MGMAAILEAPYEIWLWLMAQLFLRRRCLKSVDDGQCAYLSYKLTSEPSAQVS